MSEEPTDPRLEELRNALAARDEARAAGAEIPEDEAERFARAVLSAPAPDLDCEAVEAALPELLEMELRGAKPAGAMARAAAHLRACPRCGPLYADMLAAEMDPAPAIRLTAQQEAAVLDLVRGAEERGRAAFERFVSRIAASILKALQPSALPDLADLRDLVFERIRVAPPNTALASALGATGRGQPKLPPAAAYLAATYLAAQQLGRLSDAQLTQLRAEGRLGETARQIGEKAAVDATIHGKDAAQFADQFARLVIASDEALPRVTD